MSDINEIVINEGLVDSILYLERTPITKERLVKLSGLSEIDIEKALDNLAERYESTYSGVMLNKVNEGYILVPKRQYWKMLNSHYCAKGSAKLSKSALETLSIVAYSQPITRAEVENLRGVNVDPMIRLLVERGFIKEVGKKDIAGHPVLYGTTPFFLTYFSLNSIEELPKLNEVEEERFSLAR